MSSLFAIGLLRRGRRAVGTRGDGRRDPDVLRVMFLGGVYLPRVYLPDILMRIGDFTPPGVQGLQDAWLGTAPQLAPLAGWRCSRSWSAARSRSGRSGGSDRRGAGHAPARVRHGVRVAFGPCAARRESVLGALSGRRCSTSAGYALLALATVLAIMATGARTRHGG